MTVVQVLAKFPEATVTDKHRIKVMRSVYLRAWGDVPIDLSGISGQLGAFA